MDGQGSGYRNFFSQGSFSSPLNGDAATTYEEECAPRTPQGMFHIPPPSSRNARCSSIKASSSSPARNGSCSPTKPTAPPE
ncbi:hypothetical protein U9M48_011272, partial [Paspalum notatum var. saurae]